jgi:hypothetical protein
MANPNKNVEKTEQGTNDQGGQLGEPTPNPQGQNEVAEMPVRTDHSEATGGFNVAQSTSTKDGTLNPSVADHVSGKVRENDSMFNDADPQTAAILEEESKAREAKGNQAGKTGAPRKGAA